MIPFDFNFDPVTADQPLPVPGRFIVIDALREEYPENHLHYPVIEHVGKRHYRGYLKYGRYLESHNGRVTDLDIYQELIDAIGYLKQAELEAENDFSKLMYRAMRHTTTAHAMIIYQRLVDQGIF